MNATSTHGSRSVLRWWVVSCFVTLPVWDLLGPGEAAGNPIIPIRIAVAHIQPVAPERCTDASAGSSRCGEAVQYTAALGDLEVDLYAFPTQPEVEVKRVTGGVRIPEGWSIDSVLVCVSAQVVWTAVGGGADLEITYDSPVSMTSWLGTPLLARVLIQAPTAGLLRFQEVQFFGPSVGDDLGWADCEAYAGVTDCFCFRDCGSGDLACHGSISPSTLNLEMPAPGEPARDSLAVYHYHWDPEMPYDCPVSFRTSASWLSVARRPVGDGVSRAILTADGSSLSPGEYDALVICVSECQTCATVRFRVPNFPPPAAEATSWGRLKRNWK
jgi:hypothetical protein